MTTGEFIQHKRKQSGWSQDQLAEKLGISRQSISKWEQDQALPDLENGLKLCETLGMSVEELLHPTSDIQPKIPVPENAFQSAEKFIKKTWHFSGLYIAMIGVLFVVGGTLFQFIAQAMDKQAQTSLNEMFSGVEGMFPTYQTQSVISPFIGVIISAGIILMLVGLGIFLYGRYHRQSA